MSLAIEQKIEGKYLEESQRKAILENDKNVCVNAGAGSGKTLTIIGKIIHIFDKKLAEPVNYIIPYEPKSREPVYKSTGKFPKIDEAIAAAKKHSVEP
jgi:hypothetical protein